MRQFQRALGVAACTVALALLAAACSGGTNGPRVAPARHTPATAGSGLTAPASAPTTAGTTATTSPTPTTAVTTTTTSPAPAGLAAGPGPQASYGIEPQSAPGSCHYGSSGAYPLPDPRCTPGALNPLVTQGTIGSTICSPGYSSSIRPPESVTEPEKIASAAAYGYQGPLHTAEYDHLVPLELGGDPNDPANLWVEPNDRAGADSTYNSKDVLENTLHRLVCSGQLTLATAQVAIAADWVAAFQQYG